MNVLKAYSSDLVFYFHKDGRLARERFDHKMVKIETAKDDF